MRKVDLHARCSYLADYRSGVDKAVQKLGLRSEGLEALSAQELKGYTCLPPRLCAFYLSAIEARKIDHQLELDLMEMEKRGCSPVSGVGEILRFRECMGHMKSD
ncbi:hypothetical protein COCSUDRAFT_55083 [Coccomyxa subellipsoidea C-169]|uniref:Uncharacterized protein n=1 Tax=Coccomyxa subellipsoidea (strain C-169) TaxID=574566 RepID=I0Z8T7_COCSC|nr:hypothetical protein COCSUDRAFT_55083 [Coccomyxa subellipsoidea C-169]EIE27056.1 hypothetical protein COCSUDRAFT_55083 [Coccomyxa subellipsoidea C-169]|eukprot:XP_005651600.1 hypothetical protein COCSUDRAFT_55083 [Coccomyxa subellipsoidea C-169]